MQKVDIAELRRLWEAATKGEWTLLVDEHETESDGTVIAGEIAIPEINRMIHSTEWAESSDWQRDLDNAEFIVAAHNALPAMIDELEAAREELEALKVPLAIYERHTKLVGAAEELEQSAKTLREDLADMNPPEFASRGRVAPGYCECLQDVADGMEERAAKLRQEAEGEKHGQK